MHNPSFKRTAEKAPPPLNSVVGRHHRQGERQLWEKIAVGRDVRKWAESLGAKLKVAAERD